MQRYRPNSTHFYEANDVARSNYLFCTGSYTDYNRRYKDLLRRTRHIGPFGNDGAASLAQIIDGTSNTIAIGESKQGPRGKTSSVYGPYWGAGVHTCCHGRTPLSTRLQTVRGKSMTVGQRYGAINWDNRNNGTKRQYAWQFGSYHPGGAQFVMCDGSVRFINETVDYFNVFVWLNRISDGRAVQLP